MHLRRFLLSLAILLVGVSALPAGGSSDSSSVTDTSTPAATTTDTPTTTTTQKQKHTTTSTTPTVDTSQVVQTTSVQAVVKTTDSPIATTTPAPQTTSTTQVKVTQVVSQPTPVQTNTHRQATNTPDSTGQDLPSLPTSTSPSSTSSSSSTSASDASTSNQSSGGSNAKTVLIVGGTIGGLVVAAFIAFSIFRKLKLKPSRSFEDRMEPAAGNWEEWNDPRSFRGYAQTPAVAPSHNRSNSQASSKYSFDEMDEKAGGGVATLMRGNTIRHFAQEKVYPTERGDGLREDGRGYRGF